MKSRNALILGSRLIMGLFLLLTSVYCLLAYIPFTYYHFIQYKHISALWTAVRIHQYLFVLVLALVAVTLLSDLRQALTRKLVIAFFVFHGVAGAALIIHPVLSHLEGGAQGLVWSLLFFEPFYWLAAIDYLGRRDALAWSEGESDGDRRIFRASLGAALFLAALYSVLSVVKQLDGKADRSPHSDLWMTTAWSVASHLLIFMALFVALNLIRAVARLFKAPARVEFFLSVGLGALLIGLTLNHVVLEALSVPRLPSVIYALVSGGALAVWIAGTALRLWQARNEPVTSGFELALAPLTMGRISSRAACAIWVVAIVALAYLGGVKLVLMDWNFLIQKLSVNIVWLLTFAFFYSALPASRDRRVRSLVMMLVAVLSLGFYKLLEASGAYLPALDTSTKLNRYEGQNVSFKLTRELLAPPRGDLGFYSYLQQNTNIPPSVRVEPVDVQLVPNLAKTDGPKPYIFIITIDSLRPDYLSPYNRAVNFTPSIGSFASESVVMENAFTHYGATGLSEPSIWTGAVGLHKQYITPFYPMNTLQKLVDAEGYQSFLSLDTILQVVVKPSPAIVSLNSERRDKDFNLCESLRTIQEKLSARPAGAPSAFMYTQPLDIHVSVINREGKSVPPGESYPNFYAPYASRIKHMDTCFGAFIDYLKKSGLYDQSVIVLTADHGDSLGEEGRWGHAYTIFPEILRIPLIIHLPTEMRKQLVWNTKTLAFSTDITPSLYYLLGHKPVRHDLFGRPLFTRTEQEQREYIQETYLVASSYGAVYGLLRNNGRYLYISDAVGYNDYFFDLANDPQGRRNLVTPTIKMEHEQLIRERIRSINEFFKFNP
ncbi:MAG TPA: sulfatase-like hydrolase/transferase [Blastocatellia bacterium]|nr:sulfatase-like hydrolase/transferase [Blastocatellia bacterium]